MAHFLRCSYFRIQSVVTVNRCLGTTSTKNCWNWYSNCTMHNRMWHCSLLSTRRIAHRWRRWVTKDWIWGIHSCWLPKKCNGTIWRYQKLKPLLYVASGWLRLICRVLTNSLGGCQCTRPMRKTAHCSLVAKRGHIFTTTLWMHGFLLKVVDPPCTGL